MKIWCEECKGRGRIKNSYASKEEMKTDTEILTTLILGTKCKCCDAKGYIEKVYSKEDLIVEFIESEIQEIEITEEDGEFFVSGCLKSHCGSYDEPPYCAIELETVGKTKKEALVNALIEVVNEMKSDVEEEKHWNEEHERMLKESEGE